MHSAESLSAASNVSRIPPSRRDCLGSTDAATQSEPWGSWQGWRRIRPGQGLRPGPGQGLRSGAGQGLWAGLRPAASPPPPPPAGAGHRRGRGGRRRGRCHHGCHGTGSPSRCRGEHAAPPSGPGGGARASARSGWRTGATAAAGHERCDSAGREGGAADAGSVARRAPRRGSYAGSPPVARSPRCAGAL